MVAKNLKGKLLRPTAPGQQRAAYAPCMVVDALIKANKDSISVSPNRPTARKRGYWCGGAGIFRAHPWARSRPRTIRWGAGRTGPLSGRHPEVASDRGPDFRSGRRPSFAQGDILDIECCDTYLSHDLATADRTQQQRPFESLKPRRV